MTESEIEKLQHENKVLKNRCYVLGHGALCIFCPMECENRKTEFRGDEEQKDEDN